MTKNHSHPVCQPADQNRFLKCQ